MRPHSGRVVVADASTPTPLTEGGIVQASKIECFADDDNSGKLYIGDASVRFGSKNGAPVSPGDVWTILPQKGETTNPAEWYFSGAVGDALIFVAQVS